MSHGPPCRISLMLLLYVNFVSLLYKLRKSTVLLKMRTSNFYYIFLLWAYWYELKPSKRSAGNQRQKGKLHHFCLQCVRINCFCASLQYACIKSPLPFSFHICKSHNTFSSLSSLHVLKEKPFSKLNLKFNRLNISAYLYVHICIYALVMHALYIYIFVNNSHMYDGEVS